MRSVYTSLLLLSIVMATGAQAQLLYCGGAGYTPDQYQCYSTANGPFLCPTGECLCPKNDAPFYDCFEKSAYSCPSIGGLTDKIASGNAAALCAASSSGDPLVKGFDGCEWYLTGRPNTVVNLVSEVNHVVNTGLVPANLNDEHHGGEGTFHGAISMRFQDTVVIAEVDSTGNLSVHLGDQTIPFGAVREQSGLTVKVTEHYPYYGQVAEVVTPALRFFVHAVQPYDTAAGWSRGHLDFKATLTSTDVTMHGLLGQNMNDAGALCYEDFKFHGEGAERDYEVSRLDSVEFAYSLYAGQKASRRLQSGQITYLPTVPTLVASSQGFMESLD